MNPFFSNDAEDYLVANGYVCLPEYYQKGEVRIIVKGDTVIFQRYHDGEPEQRSPAYAEYQRHIGISHLSIEDWMLLLHVTKAVPLSVFLRKVKEEDPTIKLLEGLFKSFAPAV